MSRELDKQVAEALGWELRLWSDGADFCEGWYKGKEFRASLDWSPSSKIQDAWPLIECMMVMVSSWRQIVLKCWGIDADDDDPFIVRRFQIIDDGLDAHEANYKISQGATVCETICKGFLNLNDKVERNKKNDHPC